MARRRRRKKLRQQQKVKQLRRVKRYPDMALTEDLRELEDNREFHPRYDLRDHATVTGKLAEHTERYTKAAVGHQYFKDPLRTVVCKRRRIRREMLFKLRKIGKGHSGPKKRLRTRTSEIRCK